MLGVVDEQQPDPGPLCRQQVGVGGQCLQGSADEFGGTQRRDARLRCGGADRGAQQHHLLVLAGEPGGAHPLRVPGSPADALEFIGIDATLGAAGHQVAQFGGESDRVQRGPQLQRPARRPVGEITGEEFADDTVLLGAGDQPRRWISRARGRVAQHPEGVTVHRPHQWFADHGQPAGAGIEQPRGDRPAGGGGQPGRGQQQHRLRIAAAGDVGDRSVDQPGALAGARPTDDAHDAHAGMTPRGSDRSAPTAVGRAAPRRPDAVGHRLAGQPRRRPPPAGCRRAVRPTVSDAGQLVPAPLR